MRSYGKLKEKKKSTKKRISNPKQKLKNLIIRKHNQKMVRRNHLKNNKTLQVPKREYNFLLKFKFKITSCILKFLKWKFKIKIIKPLKNLFKLRLIFKKWKKKFHKIEIQLKNKCLVQGNNNRLKLIIKLLIG